MRLVARRSPSASRPRRRHEPWALATVLALTLAMAPAVLAAGGDHGACGANWVKFEFTESGAIGPAIWSNPEPSTPAPDVSVTEWKGETEAIQLTWSHADTDEPVWTVGQVFLKAGSEHQDDGGLFGPYPGGDSGVAPAGEPLEKGISFAVFCFDLEPTDDPTDTPTDDPTDTPTDEPTDPPTDDPTDTPTDEPTDPPTDEPTEPAETEPEPTDTEGVLPDEVETTEPETVEPEPTESEAVESEAVEAETEVPTTTPTEQDQAQVEVLADSLPATGTGTWLLLLAGLLTLAAGIALVRRTA